MDYRNLCYDKGFIMTLLCSLVFFLLNMRGSCIRMLSSLVCDEPDVYDRPSHFSQASIPPTHPLLQLTV
jgi:hypothetical protein